MIEFKPLQIHSVYDVLCVVRAIGVHLVENQDLLQTEGVFRVSGDLRRSQKIVNDILNYKSFVSGEYSVHDYIGAMKEAINNALLINKDESLITEFKEKMLLSTGNQGVEAMLQLIQALAQSQDEDKFNLAEVLHTYMNLLTYAHRFSKQNKMTAKNLGRLAGPLFTNLMENDLSSLMKITETMNSNATYLIKKQYFNLSFSQTYEAESEKMRKQVVKRLEYDRVHIMHMREKYAASVIKLRADLQQLREELEQMGFTILPKAMRVKNNLIFAIAEKKKAIRILKDDDGANNITKLFEIDAQLEVLRGGGASMLFSPALVFSNAGAGGRGQVILREPYLTLSEMTRNKHRVGL